MSKILLGLDIGSHTIKAVQVSRDKQSISLLSAGYIAAPQIEITSSGQAEERSLGSSISRLTHDMKISTDQVVVSLPSTKVITRVIEVPFMNANELSSSIQWEIEPYIPLPLEKVKMDYAIISEDPQTKKMKLYIVAAPIALIEKYMRVANIAGLTPVGIETEIIATARSVAFSLGKDTNILLVHIGASTTDIGLLHNRELIYSKSYPVGGNTYTRAIAEELSFESMQADEYKKTYGLEEDKLEGKIAAIIKPYITNILSEMEKTVVYFKEQFVNEDIAEVVVSGGTAKLPGLVFSVTKQLGLDCQINNPFVNIRVDQNVLPIINPDAAQYSPAVGLAMKDIED